MLFRLQGTKGDVEYRADSAQNARYFLAQQLLSCV